MNAKLLAGIALLLIFLSGCNQQVAEPAPSVTPDQRPTLARVAVPSRPSLSVTATRVPATATLSSTPTSPTPTPQPTAEQATVTRTPEQPSITNPIPSSGAIVVDHTSVALFEQIPEEYIDAAASLRMLYIDRSVGKNIDDALNCLSFTSNEEAPNHCVRYAHIVPAYSVDPSEVSWNRPGGYDRSNWVFSPWEGNCPSWSPKIDCFIRMVDPIVDQYDVLSFQFSYLEVSGDSNIAAQPGGYFWDNASYSDVYDQEAYERQHPDKIFIYWTTSLARGIGSTVAVDFNNQMREYAMANGKPLFDVADILSRTPDGQPCFDNRDGVPYNQGNRSEDYPDDGVDLLAICQEYTTETDGGHLGSVSAGKIRVAKAFWVLMARIAGWDGTSS
jgi:hypothetical protein